MTALETEDKQEGNKKNAPEKTGRVDNIARATKKTSSPKRRGGLFVTNYFTASFADTESSMESKATSTFSVCMSLKPAALQAFCV